MNFFVMFEHYKKVHFILCFFFNVRTLQKNPFHFMFSLLSYSVKQLSYATKHEI